MALVVETWKQVKTIDNYEDVAGKILFERIFGIAPGAIALFGFGNGLESPDEKMYASESFLKHSRAVIGMVDAAVSLLEKNDMDTLVKALKELGAKHVSYDVKEDHYPIVGQALLETLAAALGKDVFTNEVKEAWTSVYGVITEKMLDGAKEITE